MIFVDLSALFHALRVSLSRASASPRRVLWVIVALFAVTGVYALNIMGRLLDELLFPEYRDTELRPPLIITANPRSGTTFLYGLLGQDEESFVRVRLYHSLFPSVTLCRVFDFFAWADRVAGGPLARMIAWLDRVFFGGWAGIHAMGLERPEEDEALFLFCFATPALYMLFPFFGEVPELAFTDRLPEWKREAVARYYVSSLKRILYAAGGADKTLLLKSVLFAGRMKTLLGVFPGARIVHLVRHPFEALPSSIDMFSAFWHVHSPEIAGDSEESRGWARLFVEYYRYFHENRALVGGPNLVSIRYPDLKKDPAGTVKGIYGAFGLTPGPGVIERIERETIGNHDYRSNHDCTPEDYGLDRPWVYDELKDIFEEYGFER